MLHPKGAKMHSMAAVFYFQGKRQLRPNMPAFAAHVWVCTGWMLQVEHLVRCAPSPYQTALFRIVQHKLATAIMPGAPQRQGVNVSNSVMELRNICNHPTIRCGR